MQTVLENNYIKKNEKPFLVIKRNRFNLSIIISYG